MQISNKKICLCGPQLFLLSPLPPSFTCPYPDIMSELLTVKEQCIKTEGQDLICSLRPCSGKHVEMALVCFPLGCHHLYPNVMSRRLPIIEEHFTEPEGQRLLPLSAGKQIIPPYDRTEFSFSEEKKMVVIKKC